jgi:predicted amidophosphoribosyltransferase
MQPIEVALFGAVVALAAGLIGYVLWPFARARRTARTASRRPLASAKYATMAPAPALICPACQRAYDAGLQFCPHDARELVPAGDPAARSAGPGMTCPACRRSFDGMKRFCPFDGDELVPLTLAVGGGVATAAGGVGVGSGVAVAGAVGVAVGNAGDKSQLMGKICPHCSRRYESDATFCGRDGSALVSVN